MRELTDMRVLVLIVLVAGAVCAADFHFKFDFASQPAYTDDRGYGFERTPRHVSGWLVVIGAIALTVLVWLLRHAAS